MCPMPLRLDTLLLPNESILHCRSLQTYIFACIYDYICVRCGEFEQTLGFVRPSSSAQAVSCVLQSPSYHAAPNLFNCGLWALACSVLGTHYNPSPRSILCSPTDWTSLTYLVERQVNHSHRHHGCRKQALRRPGRPVFCKPR